MKRAELKNKKPVCELPIMKAHCKSCPFKPGAEGKMLDAELAATVISRTLFKSQQICHETEGKRREPKNRCKGAYDHNYEIYRRMGMAHLLK